VLGGRSLIFPSASCRPQIIVEFSVLGEASYLTQRHQLYMDDYFYVNCTNTVAPPDPPPLLSLN
jgi:hypothetical protein